MNCKAKLIFILSLFLSCTSFASAQDFVVSDPFETMIRLGSMKAENALYTMPAGNAGSMYITSAVTTGDGVEFPLGYQVTSSSAKHFVVVSRATSLIERGKSFDLRISQKNVTGSMAVNLYFDWNRDGIFESSQTVQIVGDGQNFEQNIVVPDDADLGKTRIRLRYDSSAPASSDARVNNGRVYDFVVYVMEPKESNDFFISVNANNTNGRAFIETLPNVSGKFDRGTSVTVVAEPNEGTTFEGWKLGDVTVSSQERYTFTVEKSVHLTAFFTSNESLLEAPKPSTASKPIWYQIKNAHTAETRRYRYVAYDETVDATYTSALRCEKPADITDKFLWRLETTTGDKVKFIHRGTNREIYSTGNLTDELVLSGNGSEFVVSPSGNANESYSIKYKGKDNLLMNAKDGTWQVVLYDAGVGTGSGWYFYKAPILTGFEKAKINVPNAYFQDNLLKINGISDNCRVKVFNMTGQIVAEYLTEAHAAGYHIDYPSNFFVIAFHYPTGEKYTLKLSKF